MSKCQIKDCDMEISRSLIMAGKDIIHILCCETCANFLIYHLEANKNKKTNN